MNISEINESPLKIGQKINFECNDGENRIYKIWDIQQFSEINIQYFLDPDKSNKDYKKEKGTCKILSLNQLHHLLCVSKTATFIE